jgi:glycosyltransferase involved in cell wall biosynthesis
MRICHLTSVHQRFDMRIFIKECSSLAKNDNYDVSLIVSDGLGDEKKNGVRIFDVGKFNGRINRIFKTTGRIFKKAKNLDCDIYHFHDPELIFAGLKLKKLGKKVIFDSHEDFPADILTKPYLGRFARIVISECFSIFEKISCKKFDFIVCATPAIHKKFCRIGCYSSLDINNYPKIDESEIFTPWTLNRTSVCYTGAMTPIRGFPILIDAMAHVANSSVKFLLAGRFSDKNIEIQCKKSTGWDYVKYYGQVDSQKVADIMGKSVAGLVTYLPAPNHIASQPNKIFEYMLAGIPVICSNFPLWREIIEENGCGLCVNPAEPNEIASAIDFCISNQAKAKAMGERGIKTVLDKYNWGNELPKLLALYGKL